MDGTTVPWTGPSRLITLSIDGPYLMVEAPAQPLSTPFIPEPMVRAGADADADAAVVVLMAMVRARSMFSSDGGGCESDDGEPCQWLTRDVTGQRSFERVNGQT